MKQFKSFLGYWLFLSFILFAIMLTSQKNVLVSLNERIDIYFFIFTLSALICFSLIYINNYVKKYKYNIIITLFLNFILGILHSYIYQIILEKNIRISTIILQASLATVILFALLVLRKYKLLKYNYVEFNFGIKQNVLLIGKSYLLFCLVLFPFYLEFFKNFEDYSVVFKFVMSPLVLLLANYFCYYFLRNVKISNLLKIIFCCLLTFLVFRGINILFFNLNNSNIIPTLIVYFFPSSFILFYVFNSHHNKTKLENLNVKKTQEYQELKNQINPHFLFNNLNTMISFIEENPKKAIEFGHHLAGVYRHYLKNTNEDFISLTDELSFIQNYLDIYKAKFNNSLEFTIPTEILKSDFILSSVLQEIIDNVFKHNIIDAEHIMKIEISKENDFLVITNSKVLKNNVDSTKMGLNNISKRYELLTNQKLIIIDSEAIFEVQIPILKYEN